MLQKTKDKVTDTDKGVTYTFFGSQIVNVEYEPDKCPHTCTVKTYSGPDGEMYHCYLCQSTLDEDGEIIQTLKEIPW
jgi:hypothetical protein